jgi:lysophospholipase L1-like esterase
VRSRKTLFRALTVALALGTAAAGLEVALRLAAFRYELRVTVLEATAPNAERAHAAYRIDRDLLWVPRDYDDRLAAARRASLVFLGDSCTEYGSWPARLARALGRRTGRPPATANLAVAGWTSHQGLRQIERDLRETAPRVATLFWGWNDHWRSIGLEDREVARIQRSPLFAAQRTRVGQLLTRGWVGLLARGEAEVPRVPLDRFRDNLTRAARALRERGAVPVLVTAPSSHEEGREPAYLAERWMPDLARLVPTHRAYADVVREVARAEGLPLADLAAGFDELPRAERQASFLADGIHFTREGDGRAAAMLFECFEREGLVDLVAR